MEQNIDLGKMFEAVRAELIRLLEERDAVIKRRAEVDQQLDGLKQTISGLLHYGRGQRDPGIAMATTDALRVLLDRVDDASPALTLTDACRRAFRTSQNPLCAVDLKKYLEAAGYNFEAYKSNPLSSIHSVLKRLQAYKEIVPTHTDGPTTYYLIAEKNVADVSDLRIIMPSVGSTININSPTMPGRVIGPVEKRKEYTKTAAELLPQPDTSTGFKKKP